MSKGLYLHLQTVAVDKSLRVAVAGAETSKAPVVGNFAAWHAIKRIARKAGLTGVSPHVLRHTAATHMARRGVHNEGSEQLQSLLEDAAAIDFDTARRLFTLICVLHIK